MKKRLLATLSLLLTAALLLSVPAAAEQIPLSPADETQIYAVVSLTDGGDMVADEAPDAGLMEAADSYALYVEDAPVLLVEGSRNHVDAPRFYSVNFYLPSTETEVFLTGLRAENVAEIQQAIIAAYAEGENFELTDMGFIDAEKTYNEDNDDELCWAASSSDMLTYTGWAAQAGFSDEDDVFEAFIDAFGNAGGHQFYAAGWFFNGASLNSPAAPILDYPNSGGFLNDYAFDQLIIDHSFTVDDMDTIAALLRKGYAVGLGAYIFYDDSDEPGGHALTMWGYILDHSAAEDDPARYQGIFLTDSDSHELEDADRRSAANVMHLFAIEEYDNYYWLNFGDNSSAQIYDSLALAPYSEDLPTETDPDATKDKTTRTDLSIGEMYLSDKGAVREQITLMESGSTASFSYIVNNYGDQAYSGYIYPQATLTRSDGTVVFSDTSRVYNVTGGISVRGKVSIPAFTASDLEAGDYTLTFRINPDHNAAKAAPEAFYYNNTATLSFRVRDSYLLGDYDGNGEINIIDATRIQRTLAGFSSALDDNAAVRGDINGNGLNILDATLIQRHIASFTMEYPVGEKQLYA